MNDPIGRIEWRLAAALQANSYNPNLVHTPELKLLERSILLTGWVQPILITADGMIIDGFHRAMLARSSPALLEAYSGRVPCAVLDVSRPQAMIMTIRMNRAKGTHVAVRMSEIVHALVHEHNLAPEEIAVELGATMAEVDLLLQDGIFKAKKIAEHQYSRAWYPAETKPRRLST
jgi:ParB-like chromosome segregation protein Spo0J